jgi:adenylosuccinate synthase
MQWGDEGKGKIVDLLTEAADLVARCQGGANAGHTVEIGEAKYILHLVPTGILHPNVQCLIGSGVVVDLPALFRELNGLVTLGIAWQDRLKIAASAHVVMPYHKLEEQANERALGDHRIGTTLRGIGPAYCDKAARTGIRIHDICDPVDLKERIGHALESRRAKIETLPDVQMPTVDELANELADYRSLLSGMIVNAPDYMHEAITQDKSILYEGAQGTLLDIDFGTYPHLTSSNTSIGGILTGLGIGPRDVDQVVGVAKAYCTRVGNGPFPTELDSEFGEALRANGKEYGATTGRPRRCGWLDGVLLRHASHINGVTHLAITKLDVLDDLETLRICTRYDRSDGPLDLARLDRVTPVYEEWPGWQQPTSGIAKFDQLPENARRYLERVAELAEAELMLVSTGPKRDQTITLG